MSPDIEKIKARKKRYRNKMVRFEILTHMSVVERFRDLSGFEGFTKAQKLQALMELWEQVQRSGVSVEVLLANICLPVDAERPGFPPTLPLFPDMFEVEEKHSRVLLEQVSESPILKDEMDELLDGPTELKMGQPVEQVGQADSVEQVTKPLTLFDLEPLMPAPAVLVKPVAMKSTSVKQAEQQTLPLFTGLEQVQPEPGSLQLALPFG